MSNSDRAGRVPLPRIVAAVLVGLAGALAAALTVLGFLFGDCAPDCSNQALLARLALAATAAAVVWHIGMAGVIAALRSWKLLGLWLLATLVFAQVAEFVLLRLSGR